MSFYRGFLDELMKLSAMGDAWSEHSRVPVEGGSSLLYEQTIPMDVEAKNNRSDHFLSRIMPPEEGRIVPGRLAKSTSDGKKR